MKKGYKQNMFLTVDSTLSDDKLTIYDVFQKLWELTSMQYRVWAVTTYYNGRLQTGAGEDAGLECIQ